MGIFDLSGKAAIVTGGNGGIGRGIALGLAEAGADVCIAARNEEKNEKVRGEIREAGARSTCVRCDVNDVGDIQETIEATLTAFGRFDILVNNAGIGVAASPEEMTDQDWHSVLETNLTSAFRFSRAAHPHFKAGGGGKIINIGSMYSLFGAPFAAGYAASKGGVIQLTKSLAISWAADDIQVNALLPGWIETDMTASLKDRVDARDEILRRTPAGRLGRPEDCAGAAVFLASAASEFVTGQSIAVRGGHSIAGSG